MSAAEPLLSPDGRQAWNGSEWVATAAMSVPPSPGPEPAPAPTDVVAQSPAGATRHDGLAIAGLACGVVGVLIALVPILFFLGWILGALALIFGIVSRVTKKGKASAVLGLAAIVVGIIGLVIVANAGHQLKKGLDCIGSDAPGCPSSQGQIAPSGSAPGPLPSDAAGPAGTTFTLKGQMDGEQADVTLTSLVDPARPSSSFESADAGKRYVAYKFTIVNSGTATLSDFLANDVRTYGSDGQQYDATFVQGITSGQVLEQINLPPGQQVSGYVVTALPTGVSTSRVQLGLDSAFGQYGVWTVGGS